MTAPTTIDHTGWLPRRDAAHAHRDHRGELSATRQTRAMTAAAPEWLQPDSTSIGACRFSGVLIGRATERAVADEGGEIGAGVVGGVEQPVFQDADQPGEVRDREH